MQDYGADVNSCGIDGNTPLHKLTRRCAEVGWSDSDSELRKCLDALLKTDGIEVS